MGNRLSKIYTKQGDKGLTGLADGSRVPKNHPRIEAMGEVDMLNSQLGLLLAQLEQAQKEFPSLQTILEQLTPCLHRLFDIGGELAMPEYQVINSTHINYLEQLIDNWNSDLPYLKEFIVPAGTLAITQAHVCRCQTRTAERRCQALNQQETIRPELLAYLNRLSDVFFVVARYIGKEQQEKETLWEASEKPS